MVVNKINGERWQIELFFKALKQNLKMKTFIGTSANAVRIQIWTALLTILLKAAALRRRYGQRRQRIARAGGRRLQS
jgi:IS4 transposase